MTELPYSRIPEPPQTYASGNVLTHLLNGIGYRYYWATEGLGDADLTQRLTEEARSTFDLLVHICELSDGIRCVAMHETITPQYNFHTLTFEQLRQKTLEHIQISSDVFMSLNDQELKDFSLKMNSNGKVYEFPLWNVLVGPVTDMAHHIGQVVSSRRASGNPINPNVDPFMGYTKE